MRFANNFNSAQQGRRSDAAGSGRRGCSAFTLAEVLAALLFMAIVIPVAVEGLHVASQAGEVARRKSEAARVAERILNESIATTNWNSSQSGTVTEGIREFRWRLDTGTWNQADTNQPATTTAQGQAVSAQPVVTQAASSQTPMNLLSVEVSYTVQDHDYSVRLSTLVSAQ
jgi:type II secretory pathway pseudopilin PulG